jgi:hypothetical protein
MMPNSITGLERVSIILPSTPASSSWPTLQVSSLKPRMHLAVDIVVTLLLSRVWAGDLCLGMLLRVIGKGTP